MKRRRLVRVAVAAREVDRHHEVEFESMLDELQEGRLLLEAAVLHENGATMRGEENDYPEACSPVSGNSCPTD